MITTFWMTFSIVMFALGYIAGRKDERVANPPREIYCVAEIVDE